MQFDYPHVALSKSFFYFTANAYLSRSVAGTDWRQSSIVRIPLDVVMVFSANPEDYTNRGNIITPLKDRIASQILTHYPTTVSVATAITEQESWTERELDGATVLLGDTMKLLVEEIAFVARRSELVDQSSGVSARMPIAATCFFIGVLAVTGIPTHLPRLGLFERDEVRGPLDERHTHAEPHQNRKNRLKKSRP